MHIQLDEALHYQPGRTYRAACPYCNRARRDDAVAVTVEHGAAVWYCHRCHAGGRLGAVARGPQRPVEPAEAKQRWSDTAEAIWSRARPLHAGDVVSRYLHNRGCEMPQSDVRYLPESSKYRWPVMLSRVTDARTGDPLTLHFTELRHDGQGKAPSEKPKRLLGGHQKKGGVVRLSPHSGVLGVSEGIETALSIAGIPMWACVDSGNLARLPVLHDVRELHVYTDHDDAGIAAARTLAYRWRKAGKHVQVYVPPTPGADWNDMAREVAA